MQKGFTLIELMIVVAIIGILSFTSGVVISSNIIKNSVRRVEGEIPAYLNNAINRAFEDGKSYEVEFNQYSIGIKNSSIESLKLPKNLVYLYRKGSVSPTTSSIKINIDEQGGLDSNFDIYIRDKKNKYYYRIRGRNIDDINLGVIEEYRAIISGFDKKDIKAESNWKKK